MASFKADDRYTWIRWRGQETLGHIIPIVEYIDQVTTFCLDECVKTGKDGVGAVFSKGRELASPWCVANS